MKDSPISECNTDSKLFQADLFPSLKGRKVKVDFNGGNVTSDGGVLLLRQVERKLGLLSRMGEVLNAVDGR